MNKIRKLLSGIGAAMLAATLTVGGLPTYAAERQQGTITISPTYNSEVISGYDGTFNIYRVAYYTPETETLEVQAPFDQYTGTPAIAMGSLYFDADGKDTTFGNLVKALGDYYNNTLTDAQRSQALVRGPVGAGTAVTLDYGIYLIAQADKGSTYNACEPFLVILPEQTGYTPSDSAKARVTAAPKLTKPTPDTPPETPPDNPPGEDTPPETPTTPPTTPETPIDESGDETPVTPDEHIGNIDEIGNTGENGEINEGGALTGDSSQMMTYAAVAGVAVIALIAWSIWKRRQKREQ